MKANQALAVALLALVASVPAYARKDKDKAKEAEAGKPAPGVVAYVGDQAITAEELDKAASGQLMRIRQQEFDIKENVLDGLVQSKLFEIEAAARKVALADLLKTEIEDKIAAPTKEELDQYYDRNKQRFGGRSREDASADLDRLMRTQKQTERRNAFLNELVAKSPVRVLLEPPRVDVAVPASAFAKGPQTAPVTIVEFSDYQCPYCRRAHPTVAKLQQDYGDKIRFVYRDYPLSFHPRAMPASIAARCAADQDKFWPFHTNLMEVNGDLSDADLAKRATDLGLDKAAFDACYTAKKYESAIRADFDAGASVGVTGTPAFFINGRMLVGAQPYDTFKQIIDDELARAQGVAPAGKGTN